MTRENTKLIGRLSSSFEERIKGRSRPYIEHDVMNRKPLPDAKPMAAFTIAGANLAHESHGSRETQISEAEIRSRTD